MASSSSSLPSTAFTLKGGCFCKSIRYTISVPPLDSRPRLENPRRFPFGPQSEEADSPSKHFPIISFDHCHSCRRIAGSLLHSWFICPQNWVTFSLLPKEADRGEASANEVITPATVDVLIPSQELRESTYVSYFSSSKDVHRIFCGKCSTGVTFFHDGADAVAPSWGRRFDISLGSLDDESLEMPGVRPDRQSWCGDGISWVKSLLDEGEKALFT